MTEDESDRLSCQSNCCCRCMNAMRQVVADCLQDMIKVSTGRTGNQWFTIPPPPSHVTDATSEGVEGTPARVADVRSSDCAKTQSD